MVVVLDTNVLVSGLLKGRSKPGLIVSMVAAGKIRLAYDFRILSEYNAVLQRPKFQFRKSDVSSLLLHIEEQGLRVNAPGLNLALPHQDDLPFIEASTFLKHAPLVTGNTKHYPAHLAEGIKILSPADFYKMLLEDP